MIQLPPRAPFEPLPLADVGELPVGSLVNAEDTGKLYLVCLTLQTDEAGRQLVELNLASSALSPTGAPTTYFQFVNATENNPPSNVLALPMMPLFKKGCDDADCYICAGLADPADQAEVEASLTAAGRAFGINNLTLGSIRLHRFGMDGGHFELLLGTEESDPAKPELRVRLEHTPLTVDSARVTAVPNQPSEFGASTSRGKKRSQDQSESDRVVKRTK
ncbi:hypothetical protein FOZ61_008851 [Perkinsus olseni]|uniref:Uncharacterized protein n=1 Tax=Perkinsus olseni TaxID=32597 RepID=A0A7J6MMD1_PEROL|nr:hypothetical protein FOZ61_008851 [Perkinsus olseni]KAF4672360.1 hypothetical protein FOL46_009069 [Perkinsus olseni]